MDELGERMQIELEHDVGTMSFGGVDADAKKGGDLFVGLAFGEELEDFALAGSETEAGAGGVGGG